MKAMTTLMRTFLFVIRGS